MRRAAFTTVEIVTVITIITVISGLAVASFSAIGPKRLEADTRKIIGDLCWAREMAISQHRDYVAHFENNYYEIYHTSVDPANLLKRENLDVTINNPAYPFDLTFYRFNNSPYRLGGTAYSAASVDNELVVTLFDRGRTQDIHVFEETGFMKME